MPRYWSPGYKPLGHLHGSDHPARIANVNARTANIYDNIAQRRMANQRQQQQDQDRQNLQRIIQDARRGAFQGDSNSIATLAEVDPKSAVAFQQLRAKKLDAEQVELNKRRQRISQGLGTHKPFFEEWANTPTAEGKEQLRQQYFQSQGLENLQVLDPNGELLKVPVEKFIPHLKRRLATFYATHGEPQKESKGPSYGAEANRLAMGAYGKPANQLSQEQMANINRQIANKKGRGFSVTTPDGTTVQYGQLDKAATNKAQKDIVDHEVVISGLNQIESLYKPEFVQYLDRMGIKLSALREKSKGIPLFGKNPTPEQKKAIKDLQKFESSVGRAFDAYRISVTGAAAAVAELNQLKKNFLSTDMSPTQFKAALKQLKIDFDRGIRIKKELLQKGIPFGSKRYIAEWRSKFLMDAGNVTKQDKNSKFQELLNSGLSKEQAFKKMQEDGY